MPTIVHITDLHLDHWPRNLEAMRECVQGVAADVFLVGGDNGGTNGVQQTIDALKRLHPDAEIAWVMGNHDLWRRPYDFLWADQSNIGPAVYLELQNLETSFCTVVSTYGHYDYTGGDPAVPFRDYERFRHNGLGWNDRFIERKGLTNPAIAAQIADRFRARYDAALQRSAPVVVLSHTLPYDTLNAFPRNFYGAYGTNSEIGQIICERQPMPAVLFCGHTHNPIRSDEFGFPMINTGSDYNTVRVTRWDL